MPNPLLIEFIEEEYGDKPFERMNIFQAIFALACLIGMVIILIEAFAQNFG